MIETELRPAVDTIPQTKEIKTEEQIFEELEKQEGRIAGFFRQPKFVANEFWTEKSKLRALENVASIFALRFVWKIDSLPDPEDRVKRYYDYMAKAACHHEKLLLSEGSKNLLSGCHKDITGAENIPQKGPLLIICNHWDDGPLWGMWQSFLISELTNSERGLVEYKLKPVSREVKWIIQDSFEFSLKIPWTKLRHRTGRELYASKYVLGLVSDAMDLTTVKAPFKIDRGRKENLIPKSAFSRLRAGGVVGLYPEARKTRELGEAWEGSGRFVAAIGKMYPETQILPVSATSAGFNLFLNIGEPFEIKRWKGMNPEQINDGMMQEISALIAPSCRGEFKI